MKKVKIHHPKLYLSAERNNCGKVEAIYVSNRFGPSGKLIEQVITLDEIDTHIHNGNILIDLNKVEFRKLETFISRQEKVVSTYRDQGKKEQFRTVSDSLDSLFELQFKFENWFTKMGCTI